MKIHKVFVAPLVLMMLTGCENTNGYRAFLLLNQTSEVRKPPDIDLANLPREVVYSEVQNITDAPEKYIGKTIRVRGTNAKMVDKESNMVYYTCVIKNSSSKYVLGLEYSIPGATSSLEYPKDGSEIMLSGTFSVYKEDGSKYLEIADATIENM